MNTFRGPQNYNPGDLRLFGKFSFCMLSSGCTVAFSKQWNHVRVFMVRIPLLVCSKEPQCGSESVVQEFWLGI